MKCRPLAVAIRTHVSEFNAQARRRTIGEGLSRVHGQHGGLGSAGRPADGRASKPPCSVGFRNFWPTPCARGAELAAAGRPASIVRAVARRYTHEIRASVASCCRTGLDTSQSEIRLLRAEKCAKSPCRCLDRFALTGLANRRAFEQQLSQCAASRMPVQRTQHLRARPVESVLAPCLVLGRYRLLQARQRQLRPPVRRPCACGRLPRHSKAGGTRHDSLPARVGGEEFALLLPRAQAGRRPNALAEQMRASASQPVAFGLRKPSPALERITISMGVTQMTRWRECQRFLRAALTAPSMPPNAVVATVSPCSARRRPEPAPMHSISLHRQLRLRRLRRAPHDARVAAQT